MLLAGPHLYMAYSKRSEGQTIRVSGSKGYIVVNWITCVEQKYS